MTSAEIVRTFRAKRVGNKKWRAVCPIHGGKHSGPLSITENNQGVGIMCFGGCDTRDVLDKVGLTFSDLFRDASTPQVRARTSLYEMRDNTERRLGLVMWLSALDSDWAMIQKRIECELAIIRCKIDPAKIYQEYRERKLQGRIKRLGWDRLWEGVQDGVYSADGRIADSQRPVR